MHFLFAETESYLVAFPNPSASNLWPRSLLCIFINFTTWKQDQRKKSWNIYSRIPNILVWIPKQKHVLISKNTLQSKYPILAKLDDLPCHYFAIPLTKTRTRQFLSPVNPQHVRLKKKKNGSSGKKMQLPEQNKAKQWKRKTQVMIRCTIY